VNLFENRSLIVEDGVMIIISSELINEPPKDDGYIKPSSNATSEVEELEATDICVIVDSKGL